MAGILGRGEVYEEVAKGNFNFMKKYYTAEECVFLPSPLSTDGDTAFHMAVYSKTNQPLQHLLEIAEGHSEVETVYRKENIYGITPLHMAAKVGKLEAVKLLVEKDQDLIDKYLVEKDKGLIDKHDKLEETPLFKAAANGHRKVMLYLASQEGQIDGSGDKKLKEIHRRRKDGYPILYMAIRGDHLGTALGLVKLDESLALEKDASGISCLQLLANLPSYFKSGYLMHLWNTIIYFCDVHDDHDRSKATKTTAPYAAFWRFLSKVRPEIGNFWREKRKHEFALELAKILIDKDNSWQQGLSPVVYTTSSYSAATSESGKAQEPPSFLTQFENREIENGVGLDPNIESVENPLFTATKNGIVEIVNEMLRVYPYVVEIHNRKSQSILHVAILCRQKKIFNLVKKMKIALKRLVEGIDENDYSILHCAADMKYYTGTSRPGPAFQLQDEFKWFHRVKKLVPPHLAMLHKAAIDMNVEVPPHSDMRGKKKMTAREFFDEQHREKLKEAQEWIKQTSQSCSTVAVLVATVVFAAAYTVPGGLNESGFLHFLNSPSFLFFTVMDVVSLACSLTAVVMFLSILSSPFEINDFYYSLPRKLTIGFTLLFLSVATTTLAFASTVLLIIRLEVRQLTSTLIYTAAFLPVGILALMQFRLYIAFVESLTSISKVIRKIIPLKLVHRLLKIQGTYLVPYLV